MLPASLQVEDQGNSGPSWASNARIDLGPVSILHFMHKVHNWHNMHHWHNKHNMHYWHNFILYWDFFCCSFPDLGSVVCPPPDFRKIWWRKIWFQFYIRYSVKSTEYVVSKGVLAEKYDILLHFAIAHMRRVDGALPSHSSGRKALNLLANEGEHRWYLFPSCCVMCPA